MGSRSASGEDEPLSSPLWQRAKVFYPHLFCYPVSITNTQIKWLWKLTKQWKYIKPKKPAPYREVLNRTFCHGKTKLCFIPVNTTSRRIWTAMSSSDISPETSGCRTSALWYFPLGSKLLSEVFHLFIIFLCWLRKKGWHSYFCAWQHWRTVLHRRVQDEASGDLSCWDLSLLHPHFHALPPWTSCPFTSPARPSLGQPKVCTPRTDTLREIFHKHNVDAINPRLPTREGRCLHVAHTYPTHLCDFPDCSQKDTY